MRKISSCRPTSNSWRWLHCAKKGFSKLFGVHGEELCDPGAVPAWVWQWGRAQRWDWGRFLLSALLRWKSVYCAIQLRLEEKSVTQVGRASGHIWQAALQTAEPQ